MPTRTGAYCARHTKPKRQAYKAEKINGKRPTFRQRGYSKAWEAASREYRRLHPVCEYCGHAPSEVTDHLIPHRGDSSLMWDKSNWRAACKPCHDRKTNRIDRYL